MECPNCGKIFVPRTILNDGGSNSCDHCRAVFHKCVGGTYKFGSPGPSMCPSCKNTICPSCNRETFSFNLTKDGDIICRHCNTHFHICLGNTIKTGSPGPSSCAFCQLKEISE